MSMEIAEKVTEVEKEVADAKEKLEAAEQEAIEEAIEEAASAAVNAEMTAQVAATEAMTAHERINETEYELERHEESDKWLRTEMENLKVELAELRSMISTQNLEVALSSTPPISKEEPTAEVLPEEPVAPEAMESSSIETEVSPRNAEENREAKAPKRRHRLV